MQKFFLSAMVSFVCMSATVQASDSSLLSRQRDRSLSPSTQRVVDDFNAKRERKIVADLRAKAEQRALDAYREATDYILILERISPSELATFSPVAHQSYASTSRALSLSPITTQVVAAFKRQQYKKSIGFVAQASKNGKLSPEIVHELQHSLNLLRLHNEFSDGSSFAIDAIKAMESQLKSLRF